MNRKKREWYPGAIYHVMSRGNRRGALYKDDEDSRFDLGMTIALLYQIDQISPRNLGKYAFVGELSLDGRIRPCNGILSMVTEARKCGIPAVVVPYENRKEAASVSGITIYPIKTLPDSEIFGS